MKILITGASGFVGSHVLKKLLGQDVCALTSSESFDIDVIKTIDSKGYSFDEEYLLNNGCEDTEVIFHIGAFTPKSSSDANCLASNISNITSTQALLQSKLPNLKRFVYISSLDVYGNIDAVIDENTPVCPATLYGWSKLFCEKMIKTHFNNKDVNFQILRLGHVYGEGEEKYKKVMPVMIKNALEGQDITIIGDGQALRTFIYIDDVADAIINSLKLKNSEIINIVGNEAVSIKTLAEMINSISGSGVLIKHTDSDLPNRNLCFNNQKLMSTLLNQLTSLENGLKREIDYMKRVL